MRSPSESFPGRSIRHTALRFMWLAALASSAFARNAHAINRRIFDCGDPAHTGCWLDTARFDPSYPPNPRFTGGGIYVFGRSEGQLPSGPNPVSGSIYYGSPDTDDLYNQMVSVQNYYMDRFNRNGPNSLGGMGDGTASFPYDSYFVLANANGSSDGPSLCGGSNSDGSAWSGANFIAACRGATNLDITGHEAAHIFMRYLRQNTDGSWVRLQNGTFGTSHETSALQEGMADFFGEAFERYVTGTNDWLAKGSITVIRSLSDPPSVAHTPPYPDRYLSSDFYTGSADAGGAHYNAGIIGKASYLAVEGGTFNGFTITGLGFDKVEQIWYRGLTQYFVFSESFNQAYTDLIHAATDLYGPDDVGQVTLALRAVEMNMPLSFNGDFNGDGIVDAADYVTWRKGLGTDYSLGSLDRWRANFGTGTSASAATAATVPEPRSVLLVVIGVLAISTCCKSRPTHWG